MEDLAAPADPAAVRLLASVIRGAHYQADLVVAFLDRLGKLLNGGKKPKRPLSLPAPALLELGALLRILVWEHGGIRSTINPALPEPIEAIELLFAGVCVRNATPVGDAQPSELSLRVIRLAVSRIARDGAGIVGCDVVLQGRPSNELPRLLAQLLWATRHNRS